jgi:hypothetical protein
MANRSTSRDHPVSQADAVPQGAAAASATLQQMAGAATAASALLRAADTLVQAQQHMIQRAAALQDQTADRLRQATSPAEVMSIQSNLLVSGWTEMAQYAQECVAATLQVQGELVRSNKPAETSATPMASTPFFQAWQAAFTTPMHGPLGDTRH